MTQVHPEDSEGLSWRSMNHCRPVHDQHCPGPVLPQWLGLLVHDFGLTELTDESLSACPWSTPSWSCTSTMAGTSWARTGPGITAAMAGTSWAMTDPGITASTALVLAGMHDWKIPIQGIQDIPMWHPWIKWLSWSMGDSSSHGVSERMRIAATAAFFRSWVTPRRSLFAMMMTWNTSTQIFVKWS